MQCGGATQREVSLRKQQPTWTEVIKVAVGVCCISYILPCVALTAEDAVFTMGMLPVENRNMTVRPKAIGCGAAPTIDVVTLKN